MARAGAESDLEFEHWLRALSRRATIFVGVLLAVLALGGLAAALRSPEYKATAEVTIGQPPASVLLNPVTITADLPTELRRARDAEVVQLAERDLAVGVRIEVSMDEASQSLLFTATGPSAGPVADGANAYSQAFVNIREARTAGQYASSVRELRSAIGLVDRRLNKLEASSSTRSETRQSLQDLRGAYQTALDRLEVAVVLGGPTNAQVVKPATTPDGPSSPGLTRSLAYSLLAGVFLGAGAVALVEFRDQSVSGPGVARAIGQVPVLATVTDRTRRRSRQRERAPRGKELVEGAFTGSVLIDHPRSTEAESFRSLQVTLQSLMEDAARIVQVTSAASDDGAAAVATNLAIAMALGGDKTLLVDVDGRAEAVLPVERANTREGLNGLLSGASTFPRSIWTVRGVDDLRVLRATPEDGDGAFTNPALGLALEKMLEHIFHIVVLSPPVLSSSAALQLAPFVDARVLCVRPGSTLTPDLTRVCETLLLVEPGMVGIVLT